MFEFVFSFLPDLLVYTHRHGPANAIDGEKIQPRGWLGMFVGLGIDAWLQIDFGRTVLVKRFTLSFRTNGDLSSYAHQRKDIEVGIVNLKSIPMAEIFPKVFGYPLA